MSKTLRILAWIGGLVWIGLLAAVGANYAGGAPRSAPAAAPAASPVQITVLTPYAAIGQPVRWKASGLPADQTLDLDWSTANGSWQVDGANVLGDTYTFGKKQIGTVHTSASGDAAGSFNVPAGFGGVHTFGLSQPSGQAAAEGAVTVTLAATIDSTTKPDGGFFTIHVTGLSYGGGYHAYDAEYGVLYDNHYMGFISGVTTHGSAIFRVRAEGVGDHVISIINSPVEGPYLNQPQSPYPWFGHFDWTVHVTAAVPKTVADAEAPASPAAGSHLTVTPGSGFAGSEVTLTGSGLPPAKTLSVMWGTKTGNRVTANRYRNQTVQLASVTTDAQGAFTASLKVPLDLGGPAHAIQLLDGSQVVGSSSFQIVPRLIGVAPAVVHEGDSFVVHLTGVGWTQFDNIYAVNYDNAYVGYGCGFNSKGDVQIILRAAGAPGYHFIDLYPSPYKGQEKGQRLLPNWYGMPQLTYAADHPAENLPAFHVVIDVVR